MKTRTMKTRTRTKPPTVAVDDVVMIEFHDHAEDCPEDAMEFMVYGRVAKVTKTSIIVHSWDFSKPEDRASNENPENIKSFTIVRKAINKITHLAPAS